MSAPVVDNDAVDGGCCAVMWTNEGGEGEPDEEKVAEHRQKAAEVTARKREELGVPAVAGSAAPPPALKVVAASEPPPYNEFDSQEFDDPTAPDSKQEFDAPPGMQNV